MFFFGFDVLPFYLLAYTESRYGKDDKYFSISASGGSSGSSNVEVNVKYQKNERKVMLNFKL